MFHPKRVLEKHRDSRPLYILQNKFSYVFRIDRDFQDSLLFLSSSYCCKDHVTWDKGLQLRDTKNVSKNLQSHQVAKGYLSSVASPCYLHQDSLLFLPSSYCYTDHLTSSGIRDYNSEIHKRCLKTSNPIRWQGLSFQCTWCPKKVVDKKLQF